MVMLGLSLIALANGEQTKSPILSFPPLPYTQKKPHWCSCAKDRHTVSSRGWGGVDWESNQTKPEAGHLVVWRRGQGVLKTSLGSSEVKQHPGAALPSWDDQGLKEICV